MTLGQKAFWFFLFFLIGVGVASAGMSFLWVVLCATLFCCGAIFLAVLGGTKKWIALAVLVWMFVAGALYYQAYERTFLRNVTVVYGTSQEIEGRVVSHPRRTAASQEMIIKTEQGNRIFVRLNPFISVSYADTLLLNGKISPLDEKTAYLKRGRVVGTMLFPSLENHQKALGASFVGSLYMVRDAFRDVLFKTLSYDNASLMAGLLLGQETAEFSSDFKDAMKRSGTTHLVALSGYNISILVVAIATLMGFVTGRRGVFWVSILVILGFVIMTGAESSVVRAALMGLLILSARMLSRVYNFGNSIVAAAFVMVLYNPTVLYFDVGFALSFLALLGIVYGATPLVIFARSRGITSRVVEIFFETLCAQLAVLPILVVTFGSFSISGFLANVLLLPSIPFTMFVGALVAGVGVLLPAIAHFGAIFLGVVLSLQTDIIYLFGSFPVVEASGGLLFVFGYYVVLMCAFYLFLSYSRSYAHRF